MQHLSSAQAAGCSAPTIIHRRRQQLQLLTRQSNTSYPHFTALDLVGPNTAFTAIEGKRVDLVDKTLDPVPTDAGYSGAATARRAMS